MGQIEQIVLDSPMNLSEVAIKLGSIGKWMQAIGIIVILWLIFQISNWFLNQRKLAKISKIENKILILEEKTNKILSHIKKIEKRL